MFQNFDPNQNYYSFNDKNTVPVVFIHGVGLDQRMWEPQIEAFKEYSIITYDLLGHGKTILNKEACMRSIKLFNDEVIPKINLDNSSIEKAS